MYRYKHFDFAIEMSLSREPTTGKERNRRRLAEETVPKTVKEVQQRLTKLVQTSLCLCLRIFGTFRSYHL